MLPALFAKSAACVDPFIYALNHPKIRQEIFLRIYKRYFPNMTMPGRPIATLTAGTGRRAAVSLAYQSNDVQDDISHDPNSAANCNNMESVITLDAPRINGNQLSSRYTFEKIVLKWAINLQNNFVLHILIAAMGGIQRLAALTHEPPFPSIPYRCPLPKNLAIALGTML